MTNSVNSNKITAPQSEDLIKTIRLLAVTGSRLFQKYLYQPLEYAGWKRTMQYETARKMMERIEEKSDNQSFHHTIAPQCKDRKSVV